METTVELSKFIPATVSLIVTGLASLTIGIYLEKFRNKQTFLKYKIFSQPLATTSQNDYWGNIIVSHNNRVVNHLSFVTIEVKNDSSHDIENLNIDIWVDNQSQILGVSGFYNESKNSILLEQGYYNYYTDVLERNLIDANQAKENPNHITSSQLTNEIQFVSSNKKFHLPVFNRHTSITIHLLAENFKGLDPLVFVSILHKSTKLILEVDKEFENKRTTTWMISIGIIVFIAGFFLLLNQYTNATTPLILCAILGLTYSLIGLAIYKIGRYIKRLLS